MTALAHQRLPKKLTVSGSAMAVIIPLCWTNVFWPHSVWQLVAAAFPIGVAAEVVGAACLVVAASLFLFGRRPGIVDVLWLAALLAEGVFLERVL